MTIHAALMTGKGTGAISTIEVFGYSAESVIREIFKPAGAKPVSFETGQVLLGTIADDVEVIDQVTLGCEGPDSFAIHCHGNPLIVEMIMELLRKHGASPVTAEQLLAETLAAQESSNTIAIEARLAQPRAKTVQGTRIIANQTDGGLANAAQSWLDSIDDVYLDEIKAETVRILRNSQSAKLIIYGCTAVLTGPPNSGKSTLLNFLAGRQKAIVTGIKGTTRDWVEATCRIGSLSVNLIDTAGLDPGLSGPEPRI
ncbi:MAG: GTPase, partial [Planctomycetota bacterium]